MSTTERAKVAAAARWGPPRHLNLSDLPPVKRALLLALVEAARAGKAE